jgi:D-amino peptidase
VTAVRSAAAGRLGPPALDLPVRLEITFLTADMAEMAAWVRGVERTGSRVAAIETADALAAFRSFVAVVSLTRQAEGR